MRRHDTVSFLSDYGTTDEMVGVVKAVIRDLAPHAAVIDLTHDIAPFDVRAGSLALARSVSYLPAGVVLAVVDPDRRRRRVAIEVAGGAGVFVGPDNGLLAPAVALAGGAERAVELTDRGHHLVTTGPASHGRDVFAAVAAHLCNGVDLADLGSEVEPSTLLPGMVPLSRTEGDVIAAEVLWIDRFGNVELNIGPDDVPPHWDGDIRIEYEDLAAPGGMAGRHVHRVDDVAELGPGQLGVMFDTVGLWAIVMNSRSAAAELGVVTGDQIEVSPATGPAATPVSFGRPDG